MWPGPQTPTYPHPQARRRQTPTWGSLDPPLPAQSLPEAPPLPCPPLPWAPPGPVRPFPVDVQPQHSRAGREGQEFAAAQRPPPSWKDRPLTASPLQSPSSGSSAPPAGRPSAVPDQQDPTCGCSVPPLPQLCALRPGVQPPRAAPGQTTGPRPWPPTCCYPGPGRAGSGEGVPGRPVPLGRAVQPYQQGPRRARTRARRRRPPARLGAAAAWWARAVMWHCSRDRTAPRSLPPPTSE